MILSVINMLLFLAVLYLFLFIISTTTTTHVTCVVIGFARGLRVHSSFFVDN